MIRFSIVIPCYNEADNIPLILERFCEVATDDMEVILVDNGSADASGEILARLVPHYTFSRVVSVEVNQGYGYGILQGLNYAKGEYIGWTHADMQTDPHDVVIAFEHVRQSSDGKAVFVKGNRIGRRLFDQFFTTGMSVFESIYLGERLWDITGQPNVFPKSFYETWSNPPYDFSLDLYALYMARKQNLPIIRFDVRFLPRIHGESSWNKGLASKWKLIKRTLTFSKELKKRGIS